MVCFVSRKRERESRDAKQYFQPPSYPCPPLSHFASLSSANSVSTAPLILFLLSFSSPTVLYVHMWKKSLLRFLGAQREVILFGLHFWNLHENQRIVLLWSLLEVFEVRQMRKKIRLALPRCMRKHSLLPDETSSFCVELAGRLGSFFFLPLEK
jgi:hypothetical protein